MVLALTVALLAAQSPPDGPLPSALHRATSQAVAVLEIELPLMTTERPLERWRRAVKTPKVLGLVASRGPVDAPTEVELPPWLPLRSCLHRTDHRLSVKALVLLRGSPLAVSLLPSAEFGLGLESTPGYGDLKAALAEAFSWRPDTNASFFTVALASENRALRHLAFEYLTQQGRSALVDEAWGAPGTPERAAREEAARYAPDCKAK